MRAILFGLALTVALGVLLFVANGFFGFSPEKVNFDDGIFEKHLGYIPQSGVAYWSVSGWTIGGDSGDYYVKAKMGQKEFDSLGLKGTPATRAYPFGRRRPLWWWPPSAITVYNLADKGDSQARYYAYDAKAGWLYQDYVF